jgi:hypothetical protein
MSPLATPEETSAWLHAHPDHDACDLDRLPRPIARRRALDFLAIPRAAFVRLEVVMAEADGVDLDAPTDLPGVSVRDELTALAAVKWERWQADLIQRYRLEGRVPHPLV